MEYFTDFVGCFGADYVDRHFHGASDCGCRMVRCTDEQYSGVEFDRGYCQNFDFCCVYSFDFKDEGHQNRVSVSWCGT